MRRNLITFGSLKYLPVLLIQYWGRSSRLGEGLFQTINFQIELHVHKLYPYVHYAICSCLSKCYQFLLTFWIIMDTSEPNLTIFFHKKEKIDKPLLNKCMYCQMKIENLQRFHTIKIWKMCNGKGVLKKVEQIFLSCVKICLWNQMHSCQYSWVQKSCI